MHRFIGLVGERVLCCIKNECNLGGGFCRSFSLTRK